MIELNVDKLVGGNIVITTGSAGHPETRVTYAGSDNFTREYNIVGELNSSNCPMYIYEDDGNIDVEGVQFDIGNTVTSIGDGAFSGCTGLTSVTIPNSVTSIGSSAFYNCGGLTSVTIPDSVTSIESWTFYDCTGLTSLTIPNSVTSIGSYAFGDCEHLTSMIIPSNVEFIDEMAFM